MYGVFEYHTEPHDTVLTPQVPTRQYDNAARYFQLYKVGANFIRSLECHLFFEKSYAFTQSVKRTLCNCDYAKNLFKFS